MVLPKKSGLPLKQFGQFIYLFISAGLIPCKKQVLTDISQGCNYEALVKLPYRLYYRWAPCHHQEEKQKQILTVM